MASLLIAVIYLAFISLGLPDSLLGSGWPSMQIDLNVPSSYAGYVSMAIALMTVISALLSPRLIRKVHIKYIVVLSICLTIIGLMGFSISSEYWMLFAFAIPYGLGAGSIDAALNNYVALRYSSRVMNFLHCFYGLGAVISPNLMAMALKYAHWNQGYQWTGYLQIAILVVCIISLPLWNTAEQSSDGQTSSQHDVAGIGETIKVPGVLLTLIAFFSYCAAEAACFLWTSSYFAATKPMISSELVASFGSLIFGGLMVGRLLSGLVSKRFNDRQLIRIGVFVECIGIILVALPLEGYIIAAIGFLLIGTGMGPIYPAIQHMAPLNFGSRYSASVIALQMASAYIGSMLMPTVFGLLQQSLGMWIMPYYLLVFAIMLVVFIELTYRRIK